MTRYQDFGRALCDYERVHHPHQVMEYTGEDDTYDIWCMGLTFAEFVERKKNRGKIL